jgi:hypothetical protein
MCTRDVKCRSIKHDLLCVWVVRQCDEIDCPGSGEASGHIVIANGYDTYVTSL